MRRRFLKDKSRKLEDRRKNDVDSGGFPAQTTPILPRSVDSKLSK